MYQVFPPPNKAYLFNPGHCLFSKETVLFFFNGLFLYIKYLMNYSICYVKHHAIKSNFFKLIAICQNSVLLILIKLHMKIK